MKPQQRTYALITQIKGTKCSPLFTVHAGGNLRCVILRDSLEYRHTSIAKVVFFTDRNVAFLHPRTPFLSYVARVHGVFLLRMHTTRQQHDEVST